MTEVVPHLAKVRKRIRGFYLYFDCPWRLAEMMEVENELAKDKRLDFYGRTGDGAYSIWLTVFDEDSANAVVVEYTLRCGG